MNNHDSFRNQTLNMKVQHLCSQLYTNALISSCDATELLLKKGILSIGLVAQQLRTEVPTHRDYFRECPVLADIPEQLVILHSVHHRDLAAHCTGSGVTSPMSNTDRELLAHTAAMKTMYTHKGGQNPPTRKTKQKQNEKQKQENANQKPKKHTKNKSTNHI